MIDSHAHISDVIFNKDRDGIINRYMEAGGEHIIAVCCDFRELPVFNKLIGENNISGAIGVHPHNAYGYSFSKRILEETLDNRNIIALGEIGLDYHYDNSPREIQKRVFKTQLELAKKRKLPVIIHTREAMEDTIEILNGENTRGIMHCFSGNPAEMEIFLKLGLYISIAGPVTYPKAEMLREVARLVPEDRLLVETDCPYLAPQKNRGERNEPAYVKQVIERIAELRGQTPADIERVTSDNTRALFNL